jgi:hypothetical protein
MSLLAEEGLPLVVVEVAGDQRRPLAVALLHELGGSRPSPPPAEGSTIPRRMTDRPVTGRRGRWRRLAGGRSLVPARIATRRAQPSPRDERTGPTSAPAATRSGLPLSLRPPALPVVVGQPRRRQRRSPRRQSPVREDSSDPLRARHRPLRGGPRASARRNEGTRGRPQRRSVRHAAPRVGDPARGRRRRARVMVAGVLGPARVEAGWSAGSCSHVPRSS